MSAPLPTDLRKVITSATVRKIIYTVYVVGIVILGAIQVGFAAVDGLATPVWLTIALQVAAYLGIPVAGLAAVNVTPTVVMAQGTDGTWSDTVSRDQILADLSYLDPDEQNTELQAARARVEG